MSRLPLIIDSRATSSELADAIWQELGRRKALWLRTKISQLAEAEDGRRQGSRGRDRVRRWRPVIVERAA